MFNPGSFAEEPFGMTVEHFFSTASRGAVVAGRVETGTLRVNDPVPFQSPEGRTRMTKFRGLETFGVLLKGVGPDEIGRGMALVRAGSPPAPRY